LKSSTAWREQIDARLAKFGIDYRFFDAIDGRQLSAEERERLAPPSSLLFDRPLTQGEVGCAASHFALIRELAGEAHDFVCVIEDDAIPLSVIFSSRRRLRRCRNSMLRMVSDPARWRMPAWQVARVHDRGIYAMAHRECAARNAI